MSINKCYSYVILIVTLISFVRVNNTIASMDDFCRVTSLCLTQRQQMWHEINQCTDSVCRNTIKLGHPKSTYEEKWDAIIELTLSSDHMALRPLIEYLHNGQDESLRREVAFGLRNFKNQDAYVDKALFEAFNNYNEAPRVRATAIQSFSYIRHENANRHLIKFVNQHIDLHIKDAVIEAFANYPNDDVFDILLDALVKCDTNVLLKGKITIALAKIGKIEAVIPIINALKDYGRCALFDYGRKDAAYAIGMLAKKTDTTFVQSLKMAVLPLIDSLLKDASNMVRIEAAHTLGLLGDKRAVIPLISMLKSDPDGLRRMSSWALAKIKDHSAIPYLKEAIKYEKVIEVKAYLIEMLTELENSYNIERIISGNSKAIKWGMDFFKYNDGRSKSTIFAILDAFAKTKAHLKKKKEILAFLKSELNSRYHDYDCLIRAKIESTIKELS